MLAAGNYTAIAKHAGGTYTQTFTVQAGADPAQVLGLNFRSLTRLAEIADLEALSAWLCEMLEQLIDSIKSNTKHPNTVQLVTRIEGPVLVAVAVRIGATRLIDNVLVDPGAGSA